MLLEIESWDDCTLNTKTGLSDLKLGLINLICMCASALTAMSGEASLHIARTQRQQEFGRHVRKLLQCACRQVVAMSLISACACVFYTMLTRAIMHTAQRQRNLGRHVEALEFSDSPHVQHLRYHEDTYLETLEAFLHNHVETFPIPVSPLLIR